VSLDNTAHLASLAEVVWGAGRGAQNAMYLKLSHGIGAGFLFDGRIFRGAIGAAGEIGHLSVDENGPVCACGNRGCLELYAGVPAVLRSLTDTHGAGVSLPEVLNAAAAGDRICRRVLTDVGSLIGRVVGGTCNLLNLDRIIVGGDLAEAGDVLLEPMRAAIERHALPVASACVDVVPAQLGELAGALGGVALVFREGDRLRPGQAAEDATPPARQAQAGVPFPINDQLGARHAAV
jgi:predicted NBD/HSP70 family sugar kinase